MSNYNAGHVRYNSCLSAANAVLPELAAQAGQLRAETLANAARSLRLDTPTALGLNSTWATIRTLVPALEVLAAAPLQQARALQAQTTAAAPAEAKRLAPAAAAQLAAALEAAARELDLRERMVTANVVEAACHQLGYTVSRCDGKVASGVEARRGNELTLVRVSAGGSVEIDRAGLSGDTCLESQTRLAKAMSERGVDLVSTHSIEHGRDGGGVLIAAAARFGDSSLARGTVRDSEAIRPHRAPAGARRSIFEQPSPGRRPRTAVRQTRHAS